MRLLNEPTVTSDKFATLIINGRLNLNVSERTNLSYSWKICRAFTSFNEVVWSSSSITISTNLVRWSLDSMFPGKNLHSFCVCLFLMITVWCSVTLHPTYRKANRKKVGKEIKGKQLPAFNRHSQIKSFKKLPSQRLLRLSMNSGWGTGWAARVMRASNKTYSTVITS